MGLIAKVEKQKLLLKKKKEVEEPKKIELSKPSPQKVPEKTKKEQKPIEQEKIEELVKKDELSKEDSINDKPDFSTIKKRVEGPLNPKNKQEKETIDKVDFKELKEDIEEKDLEKEKKPTILDTTPTTLPKEIFTNTPKEKPKKEESENLDFKSIKKKLIYQRFSESPLNSVGRTQTGVEGLDEVMQGGFRQGSVNLIGGGSGSGKSIFCTQYLIKGIEDLNETGVYISFEESFDKFSQNYEQFGWPIKKYIEEGKLAFFYFSPEQVNRFIESGGGAIRDTIEKIGAKRLVIDSLTAFALLFENNLERRRGLLKIFDTLHSWKVTSLMVSEQEPDPDKHISSVLEFQVDGVVLLYNVRKGDVRERSLEIFKMRATKHSAKIFPMEIGSSGIMIYPEETVF